MEPFVAAGVAAESAMREAIVQLSAAHDREVQQLHQQVARLTRSLRRVLGPAGHVENCQPEPAEVAREIAEEMAVCTRSIRSPSSARSTRSACNVHKACSACSNCSVDTLQAKLSAGEAGTPCSEFTDRFDLTGDAAKLAEAVDGIHNGASSSDLAGCDALNFHRIFPQVQEVPLVKLSRASGRNVRRTDCQQYLTTTPESETVEEQIRRVSQEMNCVQSPARRRAQQHRATPRPRQRARLNCAPLRRFVEHPVSDSICALMIILNSFLVGFDVEWRSTHATDNMAMEVASHFCSAFFVIELVLRVIAYGRGFFTGDNMNWNIFDFGLVAVAMADFVMSMTDVADNASALGSAMRTLKMLRIVRVFRVFRFFRELELLALMIVDSLKSLMWALLLLTLIIYVFAVCFTQRATEFIKQISDQQPPARELSEIHRHFGSLGRTVYSLLQAMLGGVSWGVVSDALFSFDWTLAALFFFYIFFTILAVLNIITGVFVDNAVETAKTQRDFLVQKELELKERYLDEMRSLFAEMDEDGSGTVNVAEIKSYFADPRVQSYFQAFGLDIHDAERLFKLIDDDESGDVNVNEFLYGCLRLKGAARSIDMHQLLMDNKRLEKRLEDLAFRLCQMVRGPPEISVHSF
mmetsp:Transcript_61876/g.175746  ORF Transcript_61876/g.175746 Transcript_61876/m.175746 type:complete len:637 (+) Transcript_61876:66-1976(+)